MKLQNLTVIFIIIILPIVLLMSLYISTGLRTIEYQALYDTGLINATHDAINAFELNTANNELSGNPEVKRDILKASIKMFEKSLCNTCNISSYKASEIEEYIPAMVFGMYDGFYMYAPSYLASTGKYEHSLKNYVYYSEMLDDGTVIIYSLDNYVVVSGKFDGTNYEIREGYLVVGATEDGRSYQGIDIVAEQINGNEVIDGINYYKEAYEFSKWFLEDSGLKDIEINGVKPFEIDENNDPEDVSSAFVQHKRKVIKDKIEGVLNSSITAYSGRKWGQNYKMPKLSEEDWQKIYSNISMITFFQGKNIGLTKYNGYCVLNSTNNTEYVNPNLMYFTDDQGLNGWYHDIRCESDGFKDAPTSKLIGYKIGAYERRKEVETNENGESISKYVYDHNELACYSCINGQLENKTLVYDYIKKGGSASSDVQTIYWTSLARERYNQVKLLKNQGNQEKEIVEWVQNGTEIQGKAIDGEIVTILTIGDYINYDCTNDGNEYSYTVLSNSTGHSSNQTFKTKTGIRWRILGVEDNKLKMVAEETIGQRLIVNGQNGYENGPTELNKISKIFGNGYGAETARSISVEDFISLCENLGKGDITDVAKNPTSRMVKIDPESIRSKYGKEETDYLYRYYVSDGLTGEDHPDGDGVEETEELSGRDTRVIINAPLIKNLICITNNGYWFANNVIYGENATKYTGIYSTWDYHVYATNVNNRSSNVRPIVILKTNIKLQNSGTTLNGCAQWDIIIDQDENLDIKPDA